MLWGSGSKGVSFLTTLDVGNKIEYVVDINPRKEGMYVAGTGQRIVPPAHLRTLRPDVVILMNSIYRHEIQQMLEDMGLRPEIATA